MTVAEVAVDGLVLEPADLVEEGQILAAVPVGWALEDLGPGVRRGLDRGDHGRDWALWRTSS